MTNYGINIQHGFALPATTNLFDLTRTLEHVLAPVQRQLQVKDIALHAARILDTADLNHEDRPATVIFDAFQAHNEHIQQIMHGEHQCPMTSMVATIAEGLSGEAIYLVADAKHDEQIQAIVDADIGDYIPYWSEDDFGTRPAGVTTAAWEARGAAWGGALCLVDGEPTATTIALSIGEPFADIDLLSEAAAVLEAMPTMEERVGLVLNSSGNGTFSSPEQMMEFMSTMPGRLEHITNHLNPITLADLNGVKSA